MNGWCVWWGGMEREGSEGCPIHVYSSKAFMIILEIDIE